MLQLVNPVPAWGERQQSPQRFAVEFKLGPYAPDIDAEFDGSSTPFADLFGSGIGLMFIGELDVQVWQGFGSVGIGVSAGYYGNSAPSCEDDGDDQTPASCNSVVEGDRTKITLVPISLLAVYRFDVMANRWQVPLVPYAKLGINYTLWWMRQGDGTVAEINGDRGRGGVFGWQANVGIALQLDIFEPSAARKLDNDLGVNHSYLFIELLHVGSGGLPKLGDTTFMGGLAFEM